MLPGIFGIKWVAGNIIFLGIFYAVICVVLGTVAIAAFRSIRDFRSGGHETIGWKADFSDLPPAARVCRHELTGEFDRRLCPNGFDCRECTPHALLLAQKRVADAERETDRSVFGFEMPADRMYHRGHTWVRVEKDGVSSVGLDDFAARLIGTPDSAELPPVGSRLRVNGRGWTLAKGKSRIRVLSPIDGEVVETGGVGRGWYLKIKPAEDGSKITHLLCGGEIRPWIMKEMERLQMALSAGRLGPSLADGGVPVQDFSEANPEADWDRIYGEMFLEP